MQREILKKAQDNLSLAKYCLEQGLYDASANRAYYAALAQQGIVNDKNDHKWVQAAFSGELIHRRKIYQSRLKSYLGDMLIIRNRADYSKDSVSKKRAAQQFAHAEDFVRTIVKELNP